MKHRPFILLIAVVAVGLAIWRLGHISTAPRPQPSGKSAIVKPTSTAPEPVPVVPAPPARPPADLRAPATNAIPSPPSSQPEPATAEHERQAGPLAPGFPGSSTALRVPPISPTSPVSPTSPTPPAPPEEAKPATKFSPAKAKAELEEVRMMFQEFRNSLGENPVGTNAEITRALLGDNLKQVRLTLPAGLSLNDDGELCDPEGVPYFFHQLSGKEMEIRSAGADGKMWSDDDIVTK